MAVVEAESKGVQVRWFVRYFCSSLAIWLINGARVDVTLHGATGESLDPISRLWQRDGRVCLRFLVT